MTRDTRSNPETFTVQLQGGLPLTSLLYPPQDADLTEPLPLIVFLHGAGERGDDIHEVRRHGVPRRLDEGLHLPAWVAAPQCPRGVWWTQLDLGALIDDVEARVRIDPDRVVLTGLSMGGFGTWSTALRYPNRFAALAPVCGGGEPERAEIIRHVPQWVFHGALDDVVPVEESRAMVKALEREGASVRYTEYPDLAHDSWTAAYSTPELYDWMLSQRRS